MQVYVPLAQDPMDDMFLVVRPESGPAEALAPAVRAAIGRIDKEQLVSVRGVMTLDDVARDATARHRFRAVLVVTFAALALLLAMIGVFGIVAYSVQQRVRDFAVRRALGATSRDVLQLVLHSAIRVIGAGAVIGLVLSVVLSRLVATLLVGVEPLDPVTFVAVAVMLTLTAARGDRRAGVAGHANRPGGGAAQRVSLRRGRAHRIDGHADGPASVLIKRGRFGAMGYAWPSDGFSVDPSGHAQIQTRLPARSASVQCDGAWDSSTMRPPAASAACEARRDVLARDRHVEMHRVPQRLGLVELLHPDRRSVSEGIHRIVVSHRRVAEHSAPEADVNRIALRRDRELHLLDGRTIRGRTVRARDCRHGPRELDVSRLELPEVATQPDGEAGIGHREQHARALETRSLRNRLGQARRLAQRSDPKDGRRAAVQHDPVINTLGGEEILPALLAHARTASNGPSRASTRPACEQWLHLAV